MRRCKEKLESFHEPYNFSIIRLLEKNVDVDDTIATLTQNNTTEVINAHPHFVHIDITPAVSAADLFRGYYGYYC